MGFAPYRYEHPPPATPLALLESFLAHCGHAKYFDFICSFPPPTPWNDCGDDVRDDHHVYSHRDNKDHVFMTKHVDRISSVSPPHPLLFFMRAPLVKTKGAVTDIPSDTEHSTHDRLILEKAR